MASFDYLTLNLEGLSQSEISERFKNQYLPDPVRGGADVTCGACGKVNPRGARYFHVPEASRNFKAVCTPCAKGLWNFTDPNPDAKIGKRRRTKHFGRRPYQPTPDPAPEPNLLPIRTEPDPAPEPNPTPSDPAPEPNPTPSDPFAQLADLLRQIAGKVDETRVVELIKEHATIRTLETIEMVRNADPVIKLEPGTFHPALPQIIKVLTNPNRRMAVYLVGGAGSGKTFVGEQAASMITRADGSGPLPFYAISGPQNEFVLSGYKDANGVYHGTDARTAMEHGGVLMIDEVDKQGTTRAMLWLNPALSNGWQDFPDGRIQVHEDFRVIVGANTFGRGANRKYVGRNPLDAATLDRFVFLPFDYDDGLERALACNDSWVNQVQAYREAAESLNVEIVISPRASMNGAALLADGLTETEVEEMVIWKGLDPATVSKIKAAAQV